MQGNTVFVVLAYHQEGHEDVKSVSFTQTFVGVAHSEAAAQQLAATHVRSVMNYKLDVWTNTPTLFSGVAPMIHASVCELNGNPTGDIYVITPVIVK